MEIVCFAYARYLSKEIFEEENKRTRLEKGDVLLTIVATLGKNDIKALVKRAKSSAEEGVKKAGDAAKKAASGVNDGLDTAKDSLRKAALAKDGLHEIQASIKDLENDNKVRTYESVYEETKILICKLKDLSKTIRKDPENSDTEIDKVSDECRTRLKEYPRQLY